MKKSILTLLLIMTFNAQAGIPVSVIADATATINQMQTMSQWSLQLAEMVKQYDEMVKQYKHMEKEFASITGSRNLGDIFNDQRFRDYLPNEWQSIYDDVKKKGYSGLNNQALKILKESQILDRCAKIQNANSKRVCEAEASKGAQDLAFAQDAFKTAKDRLNQIDNLMQSINTTKDPKAIAEVQARIGAEQAMLQNEATKLQMFQLAAQANEKIQIEQSKQLNLQTVTKTGGVKVVNYGW